MGRGGTVFWLVLYAAFVVAAFLLMARMTACGAAEVWGWDYRTFVGQIQDWRWIGYFGFRHPGLGLVCSPLVVLEHLWSGAYLFVMPAVATATAWLIWKMSGWVGLAVWLVLPTTWLMACVPESFPIAQLALVASFHWLLDGERKGRGVRFRISGMFAILNTAITLTNGVKPLLGWLALNGRRLDRKAFVRGTVALMGVILLGVGFFALRSFLTGRGMGAGFAATFSWIPDERNLPRELYGFFVRPVGLVQSLIAYPLAVRGFMRSGPKSRLAICSYFAADGIIHLVVGWGMSEPWVFAPHWIWILPILAARGLRQAPSSRPPKKNCAREGTRTTGGL